MSPYFSTLFELANCQRLQLLGTGGYGTVHLISDCNGSLAALKEVDKSKYKDGTKEWIKSEISNSCILKHHPNIATIYAASKDEDHVSMVMEYFPGTDLLSLVQEQGPLSEQRALKIFQQVVDAIDHCHKNSIAHRDIKPDNILIGANDEVRLIDFGESEQIDDFSNPDEMGYPLKGSLMTSSPQIIQMRQYYLMKNYNGEQIRVYPAEMWALGVVLYVMLAGTWPFGSSQKDERMIFREIRRAKFTTPGHLTQGVKDLLKKLLTVSADKRMTMQDLKADAWFSTGYVEVSAPRASKDEIAYLKTIA